MKNIFKKLGYAYIRKIKKWMFCPACDDKLYVSEDGKMWKCRKCDYELSVKEFEDDYVFWFCDTCGAFLNNQSKFNINETNHVCEKCGFNNDITPANIEA